MQIVRLLLQFGGLCQGQWRLLVSQSFERNLINTYAQQQPDQYLCSLLSP
jgi:hypothetical protein